MNIMRRILEQAAPDDKNLGGGGGSGGGNAGAGGDGGNGAQGGQQGDQGGQGGGSATVDLVALRKNLAGGDADIEKMLDRYASPDAIGKALKEQRDRIAQGFKPEPFPEKGTDEQKAAWRQANGVAASTADYIKNVGNGIVIGEADKPVFESFAEAALSANATQSQFNAFAKWYNELREEMVAATAENDQKHQQAVDDELIGKFGPAEYRANNVHMMQLFEANFPEAARAALLEARDENGRKILTDPAVREAFFQLARTLNPAATLIPNGGGDAKSIDDEIAALERQRAESYDKWMKNEPARKRHRELLDMKERLAARK